MDEVTNRAAAKVLEYGSEEAIMLPLTVGTGGGARAVQPVAKPGMIKRAWRATAGFAAAGWAKVKAFPGAVGRWWRGPADEAVEAGILSSNRDHLLIEASKASTELRNLPGVAVGGYDLPYVTDKWLLGSHGNAGRVPRQVAEKLRGRNFSDFNEFRKEFWKAVADTNELAQQLSTDNLLLMQRGLAPVVDESQMVGESVKYVLHHATPISKGGSVYDFDNIWIVTPRFHREILGTDYHYGGKFIE